MLRLDLFAAAAITALAVAMPGSAALAAEPSSVRDMKSHSCKDVMRLSGEDREIALALTHGYVLGRKNTTRYEIEVLAEITDKFIEYCLDHPTHNALESFEKIAK